MDSSRSFVTIAADCIAANNGDNYWRFLLSSCFINIILASLVPLSPFPVSFYRAVGSENTDQGFPWHRNFPIKYLPFYACLLAYKNIERKNSVEWVCLLVGCLTSQQYASVSQGRICSDNFTWCHTEIEVADQTFHLTQSQYTDTRPTSPSADPITPGAWQGSHWSANV